MTDQQTEPQEVPQVLRFDCIGWPVSAAAAAMQGIARRYPGSTVQTGENCFLITLGDEVDPNWDDDMAGLDDPQAEPRGDRDNLDTKKE